MVVPTLLVPLERTSLNHWTTSDKMSTTHKHLRSREISSSHGGKYEAQNRLGWEAAHTFQTSVDIQLRIQKYIPEDSELHT
jgi:hypothetical protein